MARATVVPIAITRVRQCMVFRPSADPFANRRRYSYQALDTYATVWQSFMASDVYVNVHRGVAMRRILGAVVAAAVSVSVLAVAHEASAATNSFRGVNWADAR